MKMERKRREEIKEKLSFNMYMLRNTHIHLITGLILYINCMDKNQIMDGTQ